MGRRKEGKSKSDWKSSVQALISLSALLTSNSVFASSVLSSTLSSKPLTF